MNYFYIHFQTPAGPGADFIRTKTHPLHPDFYNNWARMIAGQVALVTKVLIKPEEVIIDFLYELPEEVARARFPKDFEDDSLDH